MFNRFTGSSSPRSHTRAKYPDVSTVDDQIAIIPKLALAGATTAMIMGIGTGIAGAASHLGGN
jgi:hypothetical protein